MKGISSAEISDLESLKTYLGFALPATYLLLNVFNILKVVGFDKELLGDSKLDENYIFRGIWIDKFDRTMAQYQQNWNSFSSHVKGVEYVLDFYSTPP
eukprot:UN02166